MAVVLLTVIANRHPTPDLKGKWNQAASFHVVNEATTSSQQHVSSTWTPTGISSTWPISATSHTYLAGNFSQG